jgi:ATP-dependent DNA helicase RecQ
MTMIVSIACDMCGESAETSTSYDAGTNEIDAALEEGWVHEGGEDYCPECAKEVT